MSEDKIGQKPAYSVYKERDDLRQEYQKVIGERDTCRDLCAELLEQLKYLIDSSFGNLTREDSAAAQLMIDRVSKILGDSNAT